MTPEQYCETHAPQRGSSRYYSFLRITEYQREAILVIDALVEDLTNVVLNSTDLELAQNKLDWWREEIAQLFLGNAQHPITLALTPLLGEWNLPRSHFQEIIDGIAMDLDGSSCGTETDVALYLHRTGAIPALLTAEILGYSKHETLNSITALGAALQYAKRLNDLQPLVSLGLIPFSKELLESAEIDFYELKTGYTNPRLSKLICSELEKNNRQLEAIIQAFPTTDKFQQHPYITMSNIQIALNKEIVRDGCSLMEHKIQLTPLRKFWIAWKTYIKIKAKSPKAH